MEVLYVCGIDRNLIAAMAAAGSTAIKEDRAPAPFELAAAISIDGKFYHRDPLAERVGFEPTVRFLLHTFSKRAP